MDVTPRSVRTAGFKTVKKGYDPDEVDAFKERVADAIETAQNQATAMEARARAAVAKLQEVAQHPTPDPTPAQAGAAIASSADAENISRTLLLAQRTADATIADARLDADAILAASRTEATTVVDGARATAARLLDDAKFEARRAGEDERLRSENEVQSLLARRDFLLSDVDHLEQHVTAQRDRLREAVTTLQELVDRVPGGLADLRRPLLSASADESTANSPDAEEGAAEPATDNDTPPSGFLGDPSDWSLDTPSLDVSDWSDTQSQDRTSDRAPASHDVQ